jgi:hypothetical protein
MMRAGRLVQLVLDQPRLYARRHRLGVERNETVHVARHVEHHGATDRLTRETSSSTAWQHGNIESACDVHRSSDVVSVVGKRDSDRLDGVEACVGRVEMT